MMSSACRSKSEGSLRGSKKSLGRPVGEGEAARVEGRVTGTADAGDMFWVSRFEKPNGLR